MIQNYLIKQKIAKKMQKLGEFKKKKKLVSNDSELPNSARNGKKKIWLQPAVFGGSCGTAAVFSVFRVATFNSKNF